MLDSLLSMWNENAFVRESNEGRINPSMDKVIELLPFDPNIADAEILQKVGVPLFLTQRIINYRVKGGVFRIKSDLQKIYDFPDSLYRTLVPFIQLPDKEVVVKKPLTEETEEKIEINKGLIMKALVTVDLNAADTSGYKLLRGIGSIYAARIIKYRTMLGGFVEINQLQEVYGLSDSLLNSFIDQLVIKESFSPKQFIFIIYLLFNLDVLVLIFSK